MEHKILPRDTQNNMKGFLIGIRDSVVKSETNGRCLSKGNGHLHRHWDVVHVDLTHLVRFGGATKELEGARKRTGVPTTFET
jgi:hypothetical protein